MSTHVRSSIIVIIIIVIQIFWRYQRRDIDVSLDVTTQMGLHCANSWIPNALTTYVNKWIVTITIREDKFHGSS